MFPYAYYEFLSFLSASSGRELVLIGWTLDGRLALFSPPVDYNPFNIP